MLIFISDLHFIDETAGQHNIRSEAFQGFFKDLKQYRGHPSEMRIVFLGDIFDLNRTTFWMNVDETERPWGDMVKKRDAIERHANDIMDKIIEKNQDSLKILKENLKEMFDYKLYIPGNHDRLCNMFESLRKKVRENLIIDGAEPFPHVYDDRKYGNRYKVFARHGHEFDDWNYEGSSGFTETDYEQIPIGDLITTEIASRLPYTIMKHVDRITPPLSQKEKENLRRNLEEIDNVRPMPAIFEWLFYQVNQKPSLKKEISKSVKEIAGNFKQLKYLKEWYKRHRNLNIFSSDEKDKLKIQAAIILFQAFDVDFAEKILKIYSTIFGLSGASTFDNSDKPLIEGARDFLTSTSDYQYVVMGHTHNPLQVPIRITNGGIEQLYANSGTWRKRYIQGLSTDFIGLKNLTYTIFYSPDETKTQFFEAWTGTLKEL